MDGAIYLLEDDGLVAMAEQAYDSEDVLQSNLADHPRLLSGDQMNAEDPRRWLLIEREAAVPDREEGGDRWSADHLLVDQDAVPTIVEVKRSEDTRTRRRVVGQMLDYAANATVYWRDGRIRAQFERDCEETGRDPDTELEKIADKETDAEEFWEVVDSNLQRGKIRMVFVADEIPSELKRIVEFLNEQMSSAEILAVEVKQYTGGKQTALVPRLVGQTEEARQSKSSSSSSRGTWDEPSLLDDIETKVENGRLSAGEAKAVRDLYSFAKNEADSVGFGTGPANPSLIPQWEVFHPTAGVFSVNTSGKIETWQPKNASGEGSSEIDWGDAELSVWHSGLTAIGDESQSRPSDPTSSMSIEFLTPESNREQFKQTVRDFIEACEAAAEEQADSRP